MRIRFDWYLFRRWWKFWLQRRTRGWDDSVTWNLDVEVAQFITPRLKRFRELRCCCPGELTSDQWNELLDKMIAAFDELSKLQATPTDETMDGVELFGKWFGYLWW